MAIEDVRWTPINFRKKESNGRPLSRDQIEEKLPGKLPDRLWRLIEKYDVPLSAGENEIEVLGKISYLRDGKTDVSALFARSDGSLSLVDSYQNYRDRLKPGMVPFAESIGGGDLLLLDMGDYRPGAVFFWWHEAPCAEDSDHSLCLVAETFDEFCDRVTPIPDGAY